MTDININEILEMLNVKGWKQKEVAKKFGVSEKTIARKLVDYKYNRSTKKYELQEFTLKVVEVEEVEEVEKRVARTFRIDRDITEAMAYMAINEKIEHQEIVNKALRAFIDKKYFSLFID